MRPMGGGMKGYCSSYVNDSFGFDDPSSLNFSHSPDYGSLYLKQFSLELIEENIFPNTEEFEALVGSI